MISTLIFYNIVLFLSTGLVFLSERTTTKLQGYLLKLMALVIVAFPVGLRYGLGRDYISYKRIYENIAHNADSYTSIEFGFYVLNRIFSFSGLNYEIFTLFISLFIFGVALKACPTKRKAFSFFLFILLFYFESFNIIRSVMVSSLMFLGITSYQKNRKTLNYLVLNAISFSIHKSAVIFFPILLFDKLIRRDILRFFVATFLFFSVFYFFYGRYIIDLIYSLAIVEQLGYSTYQGGRHDEISKFGTGVGYISRLGILIYPLLLSSFFLQKNPKNKVFIIVISISLATTLLSPYSGIFGILERLLYIGYILSILLVYSYKEIKFRKYYLILSVSLLYIFFNLKVFNGNTSFDAACINQSNMLYPYVSVFNKDDATAPMRNGCF